MADLRRIRVLAVVFAMMLSACTCRMCAQPQSEVELARAQKPAELPTRRARPARPERERIALPTPAVGTIAAPTPAEVSVPEDFPSDVPILKDSQVMAVQKLAGNARNVLFRTDKPGPEVHAYYRKEMQDGGWNMDQEFETPEHSFMSFTRGKTRINLQIAKEPGGNQQIVGIMYEDEKDLPFPEF